MIEIGALQSLDDFRIHNAYRIKVHNQLVHIIQGVPDKKMLNIKLMKTIMNLKYKFDYINCIKNS